MAVPIFYERRGRGKGLPTAAPGLRPGEPLCGSLPPPQNRFQPIRRPYSVPVTTTVVTPGATVTAPVVLS